MKHGHQNKHTVGRFHYFSGRNRTGFSLVELSIVLVILGLLVGGILGGKSLIRAAELRSVVTQHDQILASIHSFRDKYLALPGDMPNATSFWTALSPVASCMTGSSSDQKTCDGNGDGRVNAFNTHVAPYYADYESSRIWQHLANGGLIAGQFTGYPSYYTYGAGPGVSMPGKFANSYWASYTWSNGVNENNAYTNGNYFTVPLGHLILLGGVSSAAYTSSLLPILTPPELWNIDSKVDDGKPATGKVIVHAPDNGLDQCTDATGTPAVQQTLVNSNYLLSSSTVACVIAWRQQY